MKRLTTSELLKRSELVGEFSEKIREKLDSFLEGPGSPGFGLWEYIHVIELHPYQHLIQSHEFAEELEKRFDGVEVQYENHYLGPAFYLKGWKKGGNEK